MRRVFKRIKSVPGHHSRQRVFLPILVLGYILLLSTGIAAQSLLEIDRIIAIVNDDVIVSSELDQRIAQVKKQLQGTGNQAPPYQILQKQVLERLVIERLQIQVATQTGIFITEEDLNATISGMAQRSGLSLRDFRDAIRQDGYDYALFREQIREQLLIARARQLHINDRIFVSERDVDNFLSMQAKLGTADLKYYISHILIATPEGASTVDIANSKSRAEKILQRLKNGEEFRQLAVAESNGQRALDGGVLGWKKIAQLPTIFVNVVPQMNKGDISDIIKSASGFHIVKLDDIRGDSQHIITQTLSRHILIRPNELISNEEAEIQLRQLLLRVENGEDFGELARSHSDDRGSAINNGELGWMNPGDLVSKFENVANALRPGEVSQPFKTQFGWHIVQVMARREHDNTEDITRAKAREQIMERKAEEEGQAWLRQLRDQAYIEYRLDEE